MIAAYDVATVADRLGIDTRAVVRLVRDGDLPSRTVGGEIVVPVVLFSALMGTEAAAR